MKERNRIVIGVASLAFVATIYLANWLVNHYGPIRVWPTHLRAPAGVYVVGLAFLLRDTVQRFAGQRLALALIALGTALSVIVSWHLAFASGAAFAVSEIVGLGIFLALGGTVAGPLRLGLAVIAASVVAAALDSFVFLWLAPTFIPGTSNVHLFFEGQFVAKVSVLVLAILPVVLARRRYPHGEPATA